MRVRFWNAFFVRAVLFRILEAYVSGVTHPAGN